MNALTLTMVFLLGETSWMEPATQVRFEARISLEGEELVLTGGDRRRVFGQDAYAVAHYADPESVRDAREHAVEEHRRFYIEARAPKLLIFHGVYSRVPAHAIRRSWTSHFEKLGRPPHESFIQAFEQPFRKGERLYFYASGDGSLTVRHDGTLVGTWRDPELVRDLWAMCLGPGTEIVAPENLVAAPVTGGPMAQQAPEPTETDRSGVEQPTS